MALEDQIPSERDPDVINFEIKYPIWCIRAHFGSESVGPVSTVVNKFFVIAEWPWQASALINMRQVVGDIDDVWYTGSR